MKNNLQKIAAGMIVLSMFFEPGALLSASDKSKEKKDAGVVKITSADNGKTIKTTAGKKIEVSLKGNPTTGFNWQMAELKGESIKADGKGEYIPDKTDPPRVGSGGTFVFKFIAVKSGKTTLKFEYLRPWEKDKPPAEKFSVNVDVAEVK
jgi:inhibitor of cysteine peptidase